MRFPSERKTFAKIRFCLHWLFVSFRRLLQISSFNGKMNALNEVNKVISSVSYYTHRHNPEEEEWLTAERMAVSETPGGGCGTRGVRSPTLRSLSFSVRPPRPHLLAGVDPAEPHPVHRAAGQPAPAAVRGEAGEDPSLCHQGESTYDAGSGQHLGCAGEPCMRAFVRVKNLFYHQHRIMTTTQKLDQVVDSTTVI